GSSILGVEMSTPGIGPATDGLSGFELLDDSHEISTTVAARMPAAERNLGFMDFHGVSGRRKGLFRTRTGTRLEAGGWGLGGWELKGSEGLATCDWRLIPSAPDDRSAPART